jgi:hypothetical protein
MKYLKRYNESVSNDEILDICGDYLVDTMDNIRDFKFRISRSNVADRIEYIAFFRRDPNHNKFSWNDVKDDFIRLVNTLDTKFNVLRIRIMTNKSIPIKKENPEEPTIDHILSVDDILNDNIINGVDDIMIIDIKLKK